MNASTTSAPGSADNAGHSQQHELGSSEASEPPEPSSRGVEPAAMLTMQNQSGRPIDEPWLRDHIVLACSHLSRPVQRVDVVVLDDTTMSNLHDRYHHVNSTTDVLTFEASGQDEPLAVDIAVCADVAQRQADERRHRLERELLLYIIHGLLHCSGFNDHDAASFSAMHDEEDRILSAIHVGRTFANGGESGNGGDTVGDTDPPAHKEAPG